MFTYASHVRLMMTDIIAEIIEGVENLATIGFLPDGCFNDSQELDEATLRDYLEDVVEGDDETVDEKWPDHILSYGWQGLIDIAEAVDNALLKQAEEEAKAQSEESSAEV